MVLDASAVLALVHDERGADVVRTQAGERVISAVNYAEVAGHLFDQGFPKEAVNRQMLLLGLQIAPLDGETALAAAALRPGTRRLGLSLGDRACLALARRLGAPVLTADRAWARLDVGVDVRLIRS